MTFESMDLKPELLEALKNRGYQKPTPIQEQAIPAIIEGRDILAGSQTGTGKTAAFALPVLDLLTDTAHRGKNPRCLVLTPTRELADQVATSFESYGNFLNIRITKIYGGVKINPQTIALRKGTDVVVATPGRLLDHMNQGNIKLSSIEMLVLDEADRMLDMGFIKDIYKIIGQLPEGRQNLMFSATYDKAIRKLAKDILNNPLEIEVARRNQAADKVDQVIYKIPSNQKRDLLCHLIKEGNWYQVLVFVRTKHGASRLASQLQKKGILSMAIHGDKSQNARTKALKQFQKGDIQALIATDIAARGLHLEDLSHVVNYDLPQVPEDYIHRIGRTGRAGKSGRAISLITGEDKKMLARIERVLNGTIPEEKALGFEPQREEKKNHTPSGSGNSRRRQPPKRGGKNSGR